MGRIELREVHLKKSALAELELPVEIKEGLIGKLVVEIPELAKLGVDPTRVILEDLCVIACPSFHPNDTQADLEKRVFSSKLKLLALSEHMATGQPVEPKADNPAFIEDYVVKIIENIEVTVRNVHMRFEDSCSSPNPFSFGITLESASFTSVGKDWKKVPPVPGSKKVFKIVNLNTLSIYMNTKKPFSMPLPNFKTNTDLISKMQELVPTKSRPLPYDYILAPFTAEVKVSLDSNDDPKTFTPDNPKLVVMIDCPLLRLCLDSSQFHSLLNLLFWTKNFTLRLEHVSLYKSRPRHKKMTPARSLKWWKYAFLCIRNRQRYQKNQSSWPSIKKFIKANEDYHLLKSASIKTAANEKAIAEMEKEYSVQQLQYMGSYHRAKVQHDSTQQLESTQEMNHFFTGVGLFFQGKSIDQTKADVEEQRKKKKTEDQRAIYAIMNKPVVDLKLDTTKYPNDYVKGFIDVKLKEFVWEIRDGDRDRNENTLIYGTFSVLKLVAKLRNEWQSFDASMHSLCICDMDTLPGKTYPLLVPEESGSDFMGIVCQVKPLAQKGMPKKDLEVKVVGRPISIRFCNPIFKRLVSVFGIGNKSEVLKNLVEELLNQEVQKMNKGTMDALKQALDDRLALDLDIDIHAPTIIFPSKARDLNTSAVIINLGHLAAKSDLSARFDEAQRDDAIYDKFHVQIESMSAFIVDDLGLHLVSDLPPPRDLNVHLECTAEVLMAPVDAVQFRCQGTMSLLKMVVTPQKISTAIQVARTIANAVVSGKKELKIWAKEDTHEAEEPEPTKELALPTKDVRIGAFAFNINGISIELEQNLGGTKSVMELSMKSIGMNCTVNTHIIKVALQLGELYFEDQLVTTTLGYKRYMISSNEGMKMVETDLVVIPPDSPLFKDIPVDVALRIQGLNVDINRHTLVRLLHFMKGIDMKAIGQLEKAILEVEKVDQEMKKNEPRKVLAKVDMQVTKDVTIAVSKETIQILKVELHQMALHTLVRSDETAQIKGNLKNITLSFLSKRNNWVNILWKTQANKEQQILQNRLGEVEEKSATTSDSLQPRPSELFVTAKNFIEFEVETFKTGPHVAELFMNMTSLSLLYHHHAIVELIYYAKEMLAMHKSLTGPVLQKRVSVKNDGFLYRIEVDNPYVFLPSSPSGKAYWKFDLGKISIKNELIPLSKLPELEKRSLAAGVKSFPCPYCKQEVRYAQIIGKSAKRKCPGCSTLLCLSCLSFDHPSLTCEQNQTWNAEAAERDTLTKRISVMGNSPPARPRTGSAALSTPSGSKENLRQSMSNIKVMGAGDRDTLKSSSGGHSTGSIENFNQRYPMKSTVSVPVPRDPGVPPVSPVNFARSDIGVPSRPSTSTLNIPINFAASQGAASTGNQFQLAPPVPPRRARQPLPGEKPATPSPAAAPVPETAPKTAQPVAPTSAAPAGGNPFRNSGKFPTTSAETPGTAPPATPAATSPRPTTAAPATPAATSPRSTIPAPGGSNVPSGVATPAATPADDPNAARGGFPTTASAAQIKAQAKDRRTRSFAGHWDLSAADGGDVGAGPAATPDAVAQPTAHVETQTQPQDDKPELKPESDVKTETQPAVDVKTDVDAKPDDKVDGDKKVEGGPKTTDESKPADGAEESVPLDTFVKRDDSSQKPKKEPRERGDEESESDDDESTIEAKAPEPEKKPEIIIDRLILAIVGLDATSKTSQKSSRVLNLPNATFQIDLPKRDDDHTLPQTCVNARIDQVEARADENAIFLLIKIILNNILEPTCRSDTTDTQTFMKLHPSDIKHEVRSEEEPPEFQETELIFSIGKTTFDILTGSGEDIVDGQVVKTPLLQYIISEFYLSFDEFNNLSQGIKLTVDSLSVLNTMRSTETQVTPPAIIQLAKTDVGKCVSINIEIPKPKRVQITFLATKPKVYADPIFFRPFILHILPMGKEMFVCLDKMDEVYPKGAGTNVIILPNEIVQLDMILTSPEIMLVAQEGDCPATKKLKAVILNLEQMKMNYLEQQSGAIALQMGVKNLDVFTAKYDPLKKAPFNLVQVMRPLSLSLNHDESARGAAFVRLRVDTPINATITFSDIAALAKIGRLFEPMLKDFEELAAHQSKPAPSTLMGNSSLIASDSEASSQPNLPKQKAQDVTVEIKAPETIEVQVLDDTNFTNYSIPLAKASLEQISLLLKILKDGDINELSVDVAVVASVLSYNDPIQAWEPVLEPYPIKLCVISEAKLVDVELVVCENSLLNITLTTHFLERLVKTHAYASQMMSRAKKGATRISRKQTYALAIVNHTGHQVGCFPDVGPSFVISDGEERPLFDSTHHQSFQFQMDDIALPTVSLGSVTTVSNSRFVCEVITKDLAKTICLRSNWTLYNGTSKNVELYIHPTRPDVAPLPIQTVDADSYFYFPVKIAKFDEFTLKIRPSSEWDWIQWDPCKSLEGKAADGRSWSCSGAIRYTKLKSSNFDQVIYLCPEIEVHNNLSSDLHYKIGSTEFTILKQGQNQSIYEAEPATTLGQLIVSFVGFSPQPIDLVTLSVIEPTPFLFYPDHVKESRSHPLKVLVSVDMTNNGFTKSIHFYSDFWILNHTQLPLHYFYDGKMLAGQLEDSLLSNEQKTLCYSPTSTLQIRVGADGRLNDPIDLKAPTANGTAVAIQNADWNFIISISSQQGPRSFSKTTIIEIFPSFMLVNNSEYPLVVKLAESSRPLAVHARKQMPLYFPIGSNVGDLRIALAFPPFTRDFKKGESNVNFDFPPGWLFTMPVVSDYLAPHGDDFTILGDFDKELDLHWTQAFAMEEFAAGVSFKMEYGIVFRGNVKLQRELGYIIISQEVLSMGDHPPPPKSFHVKIASVEARPMSIGISVIDQKPQELAYICLHNVAVDLQRNANFNTDQLEISIGRIQIDNQLYNTPHPIVLCPSERSAPWLTVSANRDLKFDPMLYMKTFCVQIKSLDLAIDEVFLSAVIDYMTHIITNILLVGYHQEQQILNNVPTSLILPDSELDVSKSHFDALALLPQKVFVSFTAVAEGRTKTNAFQQIDDQFRLGLNMGMILDLIGNIDRASITIPPYKEMEITKPMNDILTDIGKFFAESWKVGWIPQVLANSNISGLGYAVSNVGISVSSFFKAPYRGAQQDGISGLGRGLADGSAKLASGLFNGVIGGAGRTFYDVGGIAAKLSANPEFEKERRIEKQNPENAPSNVASGFLYGAKKIGEGVLHGVTGIFIEPYKGAQQEGALGVAKGLGRGAVGIIMRPVAGICDGIDQVATGAQNSFKAEKIPDMYRRVRLPRYIGSTNKIESFSPSHSEGQQILQFVLEKGRWKTHKYVYHTKINETQSIMVSTTRLFLFNSLEGFIIWSSSKIRKDNWVSVTREIEKGFIELEFWSDSWEYQKEILKISEKECISRLLLHLYDVATISKRELQFCYLQNLKHQVEKEGFLKMKLQKQEAWRTYYCRLSNGGIDLYSFDNGTQFQGRVLVKSSPVITKVYFKDKDNIFAVLQISREGTTYFQAPSLSEKNEWIHVCLQNHAYLFEVLEEPPSMVMLSLKSRCENQKSFLAITNKEMVIQEQVSNETMLWLESCGPEEAYLKTSVQRDGKAYFASCTSKGKLLAIHTRKERECIFRVVEIDKRIALRSIYGTYITTDGLHKKVICNTTSVGVNNLFAKIFPYVSIALRSQSTHNFVTVSTTTYTLRAIKKTVGEAEKFQLRQLPGSHLTLKCWAGQLLQINPRNNKVACDQKTQATGNNLFMIERLSNGLSIIRGPRDLYLYLIQGLQGPEVAATSNHAQAEKFHIVYTVG